MLPCEGQHHTVAIYAKSNNKIQRIVNYCHCCIALNNRGMFEQDWSDMPQRRGMSDHSGCNHILRYIFQTIQDN